MITKWLKSILFLFAVLLNNAPHSLATWHSESTFTPNTCLPFVPIDRFVFSPDSQLLLTSWDNGARLWDIESGRSIQFFPIEGKTYSRINIDISPDGNLIAAATDLQTSIWDTNTGEQLYTLPLNNRYDTVVNFSTSGRYVFTSSVDGASLWSIETGERIHNFEGEQDPDIKQRGSLSPNEEYVLTTNGRSHVNIWNAISGNKIYTIDGARRASFAPDSSSTLSNENNQLTLRNLETFDVIQQFSPAVGVPIDWRFSPDGRYLLSAIDSGFDQRGTVVLWEVETGEIIHEFSEGTKWSWFNFFPNSNELLMLDWTLVQNDNLNQTPVLIWNTTAMSQEIITINADIYHQSPISPNGQYWAFDADPTGLTVLDFTTQRLQRLC